MTKTILAAAMLATAMLHQATAQAADGLRAALDGKRAVAGQCLASDVAAVSTGRKSARPDLGCAMRASELGPLLGKADVALVDVRPKADFDAFHGDGALNLATASVATKTFLKRQQVILVGSGRNDRDLYALCGELKAAGFQRVKVLQGGMVSWAVDKLPGIGMQPQPAALAALSPDELQLAAAFEANAVLVPPSGKEFTSRLPKVVSVTGTSVADIRTAVERARKRNVLAGVVLVMGSAYEARDYDSMRSGLGETPLLVYPGSLAAYDSYVADQKAIWAAQARGPKRPGCSF